MKNYISKQEGVWKQVIKVVLSEEEKALLQDFSVESRESRKALSSRIQSEREIDVPNNVVDSLQSIYSENKPEEDYQLIAVNITEIEGNYSGIINCRIRGNHVQIRF